MTRFKVITITSQNPPYHALVALERMVALLHDPQLKLQRTVDITTTGLM